VDFRIENSGIHVVRWLDNSAVQLSSKHAAVEPTSTLRRWDKKQHKYVQVPRPAVRKYNEHMDFFDMLMSLCLTGFYYKRQSSTHKCQQTARAVAAVKPGRTTSKAVINRSKFGVDWFSSFGSGEEQNLMIPIGTTTGSYHCSATALARDIKLCLWRRVEVSCFITTTADAINTARPCIACLW